MQNTPDTTTQQRTIDLQSLSARQRRLVERHMPLIGLTLQRHFRVDRRQMGDRLDLHQEGCLALADAIKSHEPDRHGEFPAFAMARIHFAMSRHKHENALIRVPYITQRRRKTAARDQSDRHHPDHVPRTYLMTDRQLVRFTPQDRTAEPHGPPVNSGARTLGDLVRECYDTALQETVARESNPPSSETTATLIRHCADERWSIPESECQKSFRELAISLNCPRSQIVRRDQRIRGLIRQRLQRDPRYRESIRLARTQRAGLRYVPTAEELAAIESMNNTG
jgi:hypothetical protein